MPFEAGVMIDASSVDDLQPLARHIAVGVDRDLALTLLNQPTTEMTTLLCVRSNQP